jgi:hypothetical protein
MREFLSSIYDALVDRSPQELIGAILIALTISMATAGLFILLRRKVSDSLTLLTGLTLLASTTSMALAAGYVLPSHRHARGEAIGPARPPHWPPPVPERYLVRRIIEVADRDDDGILSADEAADAAARLVREADASGKGSLDSATLAHALRETIFPPHRRPFPGNLEPEQERRRMRPSPPSDHPKLGRMDAVE